MKKYIYVIVFVFATCCAATELPVAPNGFLWQEVPTIKAAILRPNDWFYKEDQSGTTTALFITKESIQKKGRFETGLTLNCVRDIPAKAGMPPSAYAVAFAQEAATKHKLDEQMAFDHGPFKAVRFRYVDASKGITSVTICHLLIANDKTGTLFLVIFEAPTKNWENEWKLGEVILKKMLLDNDV
ncbi:MAG: hypothetical protein QM715_14430 [Nibricoccus sp.]